MKWQLIKAEKIKGEINTMQSMTLPDQTMSIPELIKRYAQGLPLGAPNVPLYEENPEEDLLGGRNWNTLDLTEKQEFIKSAKNEIQQINKRINKKKSDTIQQGVTGDVPPNEIE
jgi:hypothetical protein